VQADGDIVCFLAVHHMAYKHGMDRETILRHMPILARAVDEYFSAKIQVHAGAPAGAEIT
jgi:hypothetical protein